MKNVFFMLSVVFLCSCAAHQESMQSNCSSYGFSPGTEAFANCMMQQDMARRQAIQQYLMTRPVTVPNAQYIPPSPPITTQTTTNCYMFGNQVQCTSR